MINCRVTEEVASVKALYEIKRKGNFFSQSIKCSFSKIRLIISTQPSGSITAHGMRTVNGHFVTECDSASNIKYGEHLRNLGQVCGCEVLRQNRFNPRGCRAEATGQEIFSRTKGKVTLIELVAKCATHDHCTERQVRVRSRKPTERMTNETYMSVKRLV